METKEILILLNRWWITGKVKPELIHTHKRNVFHNIFNDIINYKEIIFLTGIRRVGKTTIIYQLINELLKNIKPYNIIYFIFDYNNDNLLNIYINILLIR